MTDGMSREAEVGENVPGVPGQKHIRGVTGHGEDRNETDVEDSLFPGFQHVERRVEIVHEVVPLELLVEPVQALHLVSHFVV